MENNNFYDKYKLVYKKLKNIFSLIYEEYSIKNEVNPIEHIKCRIKKRDSIEKKLMKKGLEIGNDSIDNLHDIVGVRIVCSFLSDLENLKHVIRTLDNNNILQIIKEKDYITKPKEDSGYASYHMQIRVPVTYNNEIVFVNAEIQIRTIAMDMSASIEHKLCYKNELCDQRLKFLMKGITDFCSKMDEDLDIVVRSINKNEFRILDDNYSVMDSKEFELFKSKYNSALNFTRDKFLLLYKNFDYNNGVNPIEHIKTRLKSNDKIVRKLTDKNKDISIENIERYVNDFAGIKLVCSFISDLEKIKDYIRNDSDFVIIDEKDYITNPKDSGYRGYHFLVGVPVYTIDGINYVKVEIQLRTVAMEMWASLEGKIGYHKETNDTLRNDLKRVSTYLMEFDNNIDDMYNYNNLEHDVDTKKLVKQI